MVKRFVGKVFCLLVPFFLVTQFSYANDQQLVNQTTSSKSTKMVLALSMIWEGDQLHNTTLKAAKDFRREFSHIPLIHFISPVYGTHQDEALSIKSEKLHSVIDATDTVGLYLNPWKSFVTHSLVPFRDAPTFWGESLTESDCRKDCGREVPLSAYSESEIDRLIKESFNQFQALNLPKPNHFMAGGWLASEDVLTVAAANGFSHDYSAIPMELISEKSSSYPLYSWLEQIWSDIEPLSQPKILYTKRGAILEMTNNGGTVDYLTEQEIVQRFEQHIVAMQGSQTEQFYHLGFYQETLYKTLPRVMKSLRAIEKIASEKGVILEYYSPSPIGQASVGGPISH